MSNKPVPSDSIEDLKLNVLVEDVVVTSKEKEYTPNRLGEEILTLHGMEKKHARMLAYQKEQFETFLSSSGFQDLGSYRPGLLITSKNQGFTRCVSGQGCSFYTPSVGLELPYQTTGDWQVEGGFFVVRGDYSLRQDLALASPGAGIVGYSPASAYPDGSVGKELQLIPGKVKEDADRAEAAADAATVNSTVYPTPEIGLTSVSDGEYFLVIGANENQAARLYLRINSGDGRLQKIYPTLAAVESVSADVASLLTSVSGISTSISREGDLVFGRDSNPITGSNIPGGTYIYANPVPATGSVTSIRAFCKTPGDLRINIYQRTGNRVDRKFTTTRPLIAGLNEILFGENDIPVSNGEYLSFSCAAGVLSFTAAPGDEGGHYIFTNQDIETGNLGGITKSARLQFSATITGQVQIQVGEELDSLQEQINQLGPSSGSIATDGRTLFRYRARIGTLDATTLGQCKVLMLGDSWSEHARIPQQLRNVLESRIGGVSAYGWIDAIGGSPMQGLSYGRTGAWTTYSTATGGAVPAVGTGPDGRVVYTDAIDATAQITTTCESFKIYYRDTTGSFRWRVDGGAWTTVSGTGSGDIAVVTIDGLPHASHTFRLETVGNTGTVAILGYLATSSESGVVVHKCGSGGSTGVSMQKHLNNLTPFVADLDPDVAVIILGTNDYRTAGATVEQYSAAVNGVIDRLRSVIPDVGIVLWAPAQSNGQEVTPLSNYVSAMSDIALNKSVEFFSNYASFGDFAQANALGMWLDALHQSPSGARSSVNTLFNELLF